jgi:hypothetical protein
MTRELRLAAAAPPVLFDSLAGELARLTAQIALMSDLPKARLRHYMPQFHLAYFRRAIAKLDGR